MRSQPIDTQTTFPLSIHWFIVAAPFLMKMKMRALKITFIMLFSILIQSCSQPPSWNASDITGAMPDLEFSLTGPEGEVVNAGSIRGKPALLFFGFTSCPDVCPTTLTQLSVIIKKLGSQADDIQIVLVSVDPDRDTPEVMNSYAATFGPWLLGLTGPEEALSALRKTYGVYAAMESSDEKGTYNVMHSAAVFAFDANGRARLLISDVTDSDAVVSDIKQLINL
jgi:protein SCO1/2